MLRFAYSAGRSCFSEGNAARCARPLLLGLIMLAALATIGWVAAHAFDSHLLGFVFADLVFLIGVALRSAFDGGRKSQARWR